jgi:hypothetical protein
VGISFRLADAPPYLQTLHAERMERMRRVNAMQIEAARRFLAPLSAPEPQRPPLSSVPAEPSAVGMPAGYGIRPTVHAIVRAVAVFYGVRETEIRSHRRTLDVVVPRQVAMYLSHMLTSASYPQIAKWVANRDHTTAMHAVSKVAAWRLDPDRTTNADCLAIAASMGAKL